MYVKPSLKGAWLGHMNRHSESE